MHGPSSTSHLRQNLASPTAWNLRYHTSCSCFGINKVSDVKPLIPLFSTSMPIVSPIIKQIQDILEKLNYHKFNNLLIIFCNFSDALFIFCQKFVVHSPLFFGVRLEIIHLGLKFSPSHNKMKIVFNHAVERYSRVTN